MPEIVERVGDLNSMMFGWFFASSFLIAVDRFCVFVLPKIAHVIFDIRKRMWVIAIVVPFASGCEFEMPTKQILKPSQ